MKVKVWEKIDAGCQPSDSWAGTSLGAAFTVFGERLLDLSAADDGVKGGAYKCNMCGLTGRLSGRVNSANIRHHARSIAHRAAVISYARGMAAGAALSEDARGRIPAIEGLPTLDSLGEMTNRKRSRRASGGASTVLDGSEAEPFSESAPGAGL
jgi:hypothetical protein